MNDKLERLIDEYVERFNQVIPIYQVRVTIELLEKALEENKPIEVPKDKGDVLY